MKYLEDGGYLTCPDSAHKRYQSPLALTEKGKLVGERIAAKVDGILERASEGLTEEERAAMYRALGRICDNLRAICAGYEKDAEEKR